MPRFSRDPRGKGGAARVGGDDGTEPTGQLVPMPLSGRGALRMYLKHRLSISPSGWKAPRTYKRGKGTNGRCLHADANLELPEGWGWVTGGGAGPEQNKVCLPPLLASAPACRCPLGPIGEAGARQPPARRPKVHLFFRQGIGDLGNGPEARVAPGASPEPHLADNPFMILFYFQGYF